MAKRKLKPSVFPGPPLTFRGGDLFVAFANTVDAPPGREPQPMASFADFLAWGRSLDAVSANAVATPPESTAEVFERALRLRAAVHRLANASLSRREPSDEDLAAVNEELRRRAERYELVKADGGLAWNASPPDAGEDLLFQVAASTALLFLSGEHKRIYPCKAKGCPRFVLNRSTSRPRVWCDSAVCGNRDKVKRHRKTFGSYY